LDWNATTVWWLAAGALVAVELVTGTFYLLMLALGAVAGALGAYMGLSVTAQVIVAALLGGGATVGWHLKRSRQPATAPADQNLDIGRAVHVEHWAGDGSARVSYRGASWAVRFAGSGKPHPGEHVIVALDGNELRVAPLARTN
jgi:membrane protein implicated in regulation of membrane protease activity